MREVWSKMMFCFFVFFGRSCRTQEVEQPVELGRGVPDQPLVPHHEHARVLRPTHGEFGVVDPAQGPVVHCVLSACKFFVGRANVLTKKPKKPKTQKKPHHVVQGTNCKVRTTSIAGKEGRSAL